jgi:hypothetical protein
MALKKTNHPRPKRVGKNSTLGEKTAARTHSVLANIFGGRAILKILGVIAVVLVIAGGVVWYRTIYTNPERVFWKMVDNNLSTYSVTKENAQQGTSASSKEVTQITFSPTPMVRDVKDVTTQNPDTTSRIKIESIGTPTNTYQHYALIDQSSKNSKTKHDYSKVYSLWLKNSGNPQSENDLFNGVLFSAALFGNQPVNQRNDIVNDLKKAYHIDFSKVQKQSHNGRITYTYDVKVGLKDYAKAVNFYTQALGLPSSSQIKTDNYKPTDEISVKFSVDVPSTQLRTVQYVANGSIENYTTYGVLTNFKPPLHTVSYDTLQKTVQDAAK